MVNVNTGDVELRIEMLGGFVIIADGHRVTEQVKRSSKIWKLVQYLVAHRHKRVPQEELIEVFCDEELAGNPGGTIRTMVYRARSALTECGLSCADDLILSGSGGYAWNNAINCVVDTEEFEALLKKAGSGVEREERLEALLHATDLYNGDFLPNSGGEMWVLPLSRWYRSAFMKAVQEALELLVEDGRNDKVEELCAKALRTDPFDEIILEYHLRALLAQSKNLEALDEYSRMETMFFDVLGVSFSDSLRSLYNTIQRPEIKDGKSLGNVLSDWLEGADFPGAYYCDLSVFKTVYRIEARAAARSGRTAYMVRIETKSSPSAKDGGVMRQLGQVIPNNLRKGDLFTRASPNQYMMMLNNLTYENCKMLTNRIIKSLDAKLQPKVIGMSIQAVRPVP